MAKYKIGYIDEKISEVRKYEGKLRGFNIDVIGYTFEVGMKKEELLDQIYSSDIDLLMIDYKLKGRKVTFNGDEIQKDIYEKKPMFPHVIFTSDPPDAQNHVEDVKLVFGKDILAENSTDEIKDFVNMLIKSIKQYKNHKLKQDTRLKELITKGELKGLSPKEYDELLELQKYLQFLDRTKVKEIPEQLADYNIVSDLSKVRKEAEEFLKSLLEEEDV